MTREEAIRELNICKEGDDLEIAHEKADEVLCELLTSLGYQDVVEAFTSWDKWYA